METTGYSKQELDSLYSQRTMEESESIKRTERLRGNMQSTVRVIKEKLDTIDKRLIEFYQLKIPKLDGTDTLEELQDFRTKMNMIDNELGSKALEYLKNGNLEVLKSLPNLNKTSSNDNSGLSAIQNSVVMKPTNIPTQQPATVIPPVPPTAIRGNDHGE